MLRQFSTKRIVIFFLLDWLGTLAILALVAILQPSLVLPQPFATLLRASQVPVGGIRTLAVPGDVLSREVYFLVALIWPFFFVVSSVYDGRRNETLKPELLNVFISIFLSTATLAGVLYFTYRDTSRLLIFIFASLDVVLLLGSRVCLWTLRRSQYGRRHSERRRVLVIGAGRIGQDAVTQIKKYAWTETNLVGYLDDDPGKQGTRLCGSPVLGMLDHASTIVGDHRVQDAIVALPLRAHERLVAICKTLQALGVRVYVIPDLFALSFPSARLEGFGGIPVMDLGEPGVHGWQRFMKRTFDVFVVSLGLILISPLLLVIAVLIKLESPGPVLYKQPRVGENGRVFTMFKFRSMLAGTDPGVHREHVTRLIQENLSLEQANGNGNGSLKLENDPRITRVGRFIRRNSLDELPQAFNVLRGEMSLVGPRPPIPYEVELYKDWHKRRFEAIPGITGLWQVKGRNRVSFDEMVRMDMEYVKAQSFWLDVKILLQTPLAVITGRGAG